MEALADLRGVGVRAQGRQGWANTWLGAVPCAQRVSASGVRANMATARGCEVKGWEAGKPGLYIPGGSAACADHWLQRLQAGYNRPWRELDWVDDVTFTMSWCSGMCRVGYTWCFMSIGGVSDGVGAPTDVISAESKTGKNKPATGTHQFNFCGLFQIRSFPLAFGVRYHLIKFSPRNHNSLFHTNFEELSPPSHRHQWCWPVAAGSKPTCSPDSSRFSISPEPVTLEGLACCWPASEWFPVPGHGD